MMSLNDYKLNCELFGHSLDIRSVCEGKDSVVTGSRDKTTKIWEFNGKNYAEKQTLSDHKNFVACVLYIEEKNWLCTASNDMTVCIYNFGMTQPFTVLRGHTSTVCSLSKGFRENTLVTGSWDKTARVWEIYENLLPNFITLEGHEAAVWSVASLPNRRYVTGSADKTIFLWNEKGERIMILKGHTDCVRGIVGLNNSFILSCGNDGIIKLWNDEGECLKEFHGHTNYIYCISLNKNQDKFITGSEDSTVRLWGLNEGTQLGDPLQIPAQSVWSVAFLTNDDILTGSSDGVGRIFTKDSQRFATESEQAAFKNAVDTRLQEKAKELGGVKVNDLPGPESLLVEGTEGQTRIVRHPDGKILCYQWGNNQWNCLGDVVGASGGSQASSGKTLHEGKEYDYVFKIDLSDTEPPTKLPYNRGEDPWMVAQKFIHKHNLPQVYLDQIANFIITNSDSTPIASQTGSYADPFTGGSRYVPGSQNTGANKNGGANLDPFTGSSSYSTTTTQTQIVKHFPVSNYITMDNCDPEKVLIKLKEFNVKASEMNLEVSEKVLENIMKFSKPDPVPDPSIVMELRSLFRWPKEILFPVLDITRLAVRNQNICSQLSSSNDFIPSLVENLNNSQANQLMTIRCLTNMLSHSWGRRLIESDLKSIVDAISIIKKGSANLEIAISTFFLNLTVSQLEFTNENNSAIILNGILNYLLWSNSNEGNFRILQSIGNLSLTTNGQEILRQLKNLKEITLKILNLSNVKDHENLKQCARDISDLLS